MKKIKRVNIQFHANKTTRDEIRDFNRILERFATEDGFDEYVNMGFSLQVGTDSAHTYVCPFTWDLLENFIMTTVCHLIETDELDKFPYYAEMRDRYAAALGMEANSFDY